MKSKETGEGNFVLSFSGGGLRATLFQLGILVHLAQTDRLKDVKAIVSVSGGSILAAHFATNWLQVKQGIPEFIDVAASLVKFARSNIRDSALIPWLWSFLRPWSWFRRSGRTAHLERVYRGHFGAKTLGSLAGLDDLRVAFVATDAIATARIAFTAHRILRFPVFTRLAWHPYEPEATGVPVSLAVAASSCFPPVFERMHLGHGDLKLHFAEFNEYFDLNDGGVGDNLGIAMLLELLDRNYFPAGQVLVCDAERPQVTKPKGGIGRDAMAPSIFLSEELRKRTGLNCVRTAP